MRSNKAKIILQAIGVAMSTTLLAAGVDSEADKLIIRTLGTGQSDFFNRQTIPTAPLPVSRPVAEWEPAAFVWINLSLGRSLQEPEVLAFYQAIAGAVSEFVPVVIGCDFDELKYWSRFEREFFKEGKFFGRRDHIHFVDTKCDSNWNRDYGPSFARGMNGELVFIDSMYREGQAEREAFGDKRSELLSQAPSQTKELFQAFRRNARRAELAPLALARHCRSRLGMAVDLTRPALVLHGGDYLSDGRRAFLSEDTLMNNGGRESALQSLFQHYFAVDELHVLEALPGRAVKHMDLSWKLLSADTAVIAEAPRKANNSGRYASNLRTKAERALSRNKHYLQTHCPDIELLDVPMPPLLHDQREEVILNIWIHVIRGACREVKVPFDNYWYVEKPGPDYPETKARVEGRLTEILGREPNFGDEGDLNLLSIHYLGESVETSIQTHVESSTVYRSYTNSVIVNAGEKGILLLLPRYRASKGEHQEDYQKMEIAVETAYRKAYPEASIRWIDSDFMARLGGALHCASITVPLP
ncbi:agmatine deiminase family protein [Pelagicoccus sp. NFK12]|uniref:Agmatine deiminase family protein n=1 Tax=Pelagicoccus enzymogenes TaxID=2773457 RepID=A0A927F6X5_9BACT|nr:agmatine deiminase family protein [Pelagicoccus enzymogenes]MBD5778811.1 agmatine deiminase family protein [Pelagicoccus enzymogenes]